MQRPTPISAPFVAALLLSLGVAGCDAWPERPIDVRRTTSGDTTTVVIPAGMDTASARADSVEVLFRGPTLDRPTSVVRVDQVWVVADRVRIHVLGPEGGLLRTIGRAGAGPGEFGSIGGIAVAGSTVVVADGRNERLAFVDPEAAVLETRRMVRHPDFVNPGTEAGSFAVVGADLVAVMSELIRRDRATRTAVVRVPMEPSAGSDAQVIRAWDALDWFDAGGVLMRRDPFGSRALAALAADGRYAWGDGRDYRITVESVSPVPDVRPRDGSAVLRIVRERPRARVSDAMRDASLEGLELEPAFARTLEVGLAEQELPDLIPSYDGLAFGADGELWVRVLGREAAPVHPGLTYHHPEALPPYRRWERYDPVGEPGGAVLMPRAFTPYVFEDISATGILELPSGELAIARVRWGQR